MVSSKTTNDVDMLSVSIDLWRMDIGFEDSLLVIDMAKCKSEISYRIVLRTIMSLEAQIRDMPSEKSRVVRIKIRANDIRSFNLPETIDPETIKSYVRENKIYQRFAKR